MAFFFLFQTYSQNTPFSFIFLQFTEIRELLIIKDLSGDFEASTNVFKSVLTAQCVLSVPSLESFPLRYWGGLWWLTQVCVHARTHACSPDWFGLLLCR